MRTSGNKENQVFSAQDIPATNKRTLSPKGHGKLGRPEERHTVIISDSPSPESVQKNSAAAQRAAYQNEEEEIEARIKGIYSDRQADKCRKFEISDHPKCSFGADTLHRVGGPASIENSVKKPFYAESNAFVDSNYTFRPNSNLFYENFQGSIRYGDSNNPRYSPIQEYYSSSGLKEEDEEGSPDMEASKEEEFYQVRQPRYRASQGDQQPPPSEGIKEHARKSSPGKFSIHAAGPAFSGHFFTMEETLPSGTETMRFKAS